MGKYDTTSFYSVEPAIEQRNWNEAINRLNNYKDNYPEDFLVNLKYAKVYFYSCDYNNAFHYLDLYYEHNDDPRFSIYSYLFLKLRILYELKNYEKCLETLNKLLDIKDANKEEFVTLLYLLKCRLGYKDDYEIDYDNHYLLSMVYQYDKDEAIKHISEHYEDSVVENEDFANFYKSIDINELYDYINSNPGNDFERTGICREYIYKYPNVGYDKNGACNYVKVITIGDTNQIVTMYPTNDTKKLNYINIKDIIEINKGVKVRKLSAVDKFNKKYNLK